MLGAGKAWAVWKIQSARLHRAGSPMPSFRSRKLWPKCWSGKYVYLFCTSVGVIWWFTEVYTNHVERWEPRKLHGGLFIVNLAAGALLARY